METKYDVFISYRRDDGAEFAEGLGMALSIKGYRVFFDKSNLQFGGNFPDELSTAVRECREFISVVTPSYCGKTRSGRCRILEENDWVHEEIRIALSNKHTQLFPIAIDCDPPQPISLPPDIAAFAEKRFVDYNRGFDTYELIVERLLPSFSEATKENAAIGMISELLEAVNVHDDKQFNVVCKDISRFLDDTLGEKALRHILSTKESDYYVYERDYRYAVFYTLFSSFRRNHQAVKLIDLVEQYGDEFTEYSFTQYVYVEYYHVLYQLEVDKEKCNHHLLTALSYAEKAIEMLPQNNGILHCYALSIALAEENSLPISSADKERAFHIIKKIISADPNYALYYCTYARLLANAGKCQEALLNLKRAQALEKPTHKDWVLRISDYRRYELLVRLMESNRIDE